MTATIPVLEADPSALAPIPLSRLVQVELRKLVDTRAGRWLGIIQALLIAAASTILVIVMAVRDDPVSLMDFFSIAGFVMSVLLPVMGILAITTEWTQRTHMATFTLEPRRGRVIAAKCGAAVIAALVSIAVAVVVAVVSSGLASLIGVSVDWHFDADMMAGFALAQILGVLTGFALGALILATPAAIVAFFAYAFVLPTLFMIGADQLSWFESIQPWIDLGDAQMPLTETGLTAANGAHLLTAAALWLGIPLVLGIRRIRRSEIK
ncbi:MAG TPA: hypothetical protein VNS19_04015 [Acidimicrobiales bacterium]|nr:hypothetical protein [Acidimicrobiales bacterium]